MLIVYLVPDTCDTYSVNLLYVHYQLEERYAHSTSRAPQKTTGVTGSIGRCLYDRSLSVLCGTGMLVQLQQRLYSVLHTGMVL